MDFTLTDEQQAIADLAAPILSEQLPPERLRELEQTGDVVRRRRVGRAGQGRPPRPRPAEADGGGGYGILEACLIAEQVGRTVAPVPYLTQHRRRRAAGRRSSAPTRSAGSSCPASSPGTATLTVALYEPGDVAVPAVPDHPGHRRRRRLAARRREVARRRRRPGRRHPRARPHRRVDRRPCSSSSPDADGVTLERGDRRRPASRSGPCASTASRVDADDVLGEPERRRRDRARGPSTASPPPSAPRRPACARRRCAITARYVSEREQFGTQARHVPGRRPPHRRRLHRHRGHPPHRPPGRLAARRGPRRPHDELMIAKFWAADGAQRVVHAAQHLHGGIGVDLDYPIHRYFRWAKVLELTLGRGEPVAPAPRAPAWRPSPSGVAEYARYRTHRQPLHPHRRHRPASRGNHVKHTRARAALLAILLLAAAACSRRRRHRAASTEDDDHHRRTGTAAGGATALDERRLRRPRGGVPGRRRQRAPPPTGVTDTEIHVGTVTDKGFAGARASTRRCTTPPSRSPSGATSTAGSSAASSCVDDLDAKLFEYEPAITDACEPDFALVGGGAVFDEDPNDVRVGCGLPNIAGYVVSARGPRRRPPGAAGAEPPRRRRRSGRYHARQARLPRRRRPLRDHGRRPSRRCSW